MSLKIGADTQRKEHQAQSDRMSDVFLLVHKCISLGQQMYFLQRIYALDQLTESTDILRRK